MSNGWLRLDQKSKNGPKLFRKVESVEDSVKEILCGVLEGKSPSEKDTKEFKKRKLINTMYVQCMSAVESVG